MSKRIKLTQNELDDLAAEVTALLNDGGTHTKEFWKAYIKRDRKRAVDRESGGMPTGDPELIRQAAACRDLASRARRLLGIFAGNLDSARLRDLAEDLEARAARLEKRSSCRCR